MDQDLDALLVEARDGNQEAREQLLNQYKPFVLKQTISIANRHLQWGHDDELSIALMGFNEAINSFDPSRSVPFMSYARMVIKSRLFDYWRQEQRQKRDTILLGSKQPEEGSMYAVESKAAWEDYLEKELAQERAEEVTRLSHLLTSFEIKFGELPQVCPKHRETRIMCLRAAREVAQKSHLLNYLLEKKRLPLKEMVGNIELNRKTLERGRKYIIAVALLLHHGEEFPHLKSYLKLPQ